MLSDVAELIREIDALPDGWAVQPLAKLCGEVTERVDPASLSPDMGSHYIGLEHIGQGSGRLDGVGSVTDVVSQKSRFRRGDILYGKLRPNLRKVARPDFDGVCSTDVIVFRARKAADADFVFQVLQSEPLVTHAVATAAGTKMPRTHARSILEFEIAAPPLDEQRRIAEVLRSVDEAIAANQDAMDFCANLLAIKRRAAFRHLLIDPDSTSYRFGDVCDLGRGFAFKSEDYVDDGVLNFRVSNVGRPLSDLGERRFLPDSFMDEYDEYVLSGGEIVLVMVGATVGKLGRVPVDVCPALLNQNMWTLIAKPPFEPDLLWHLAHVLIEEKVHGAQGGAYSFLTKKDFLQHRIGRFDADEMRKVVAHLSALESYIEHLAEEVRQQHQLKQALMSDLLSGRIRVPA